MNTIQLTAHQELTTPETEEARVEDAQFTDNGFTVKLSLGNGSMVAVFQDPQKAWELIASAGVAGPEELKGKTVLAHMDGVKLVGISLR